MKKINTTNYGLTISDFEFELDLRFAHRQDGFTSIAMILTEIDGNVAVTKPKLVNSDSMSILRTINKLLLQLLSHWITPEGKANRQEIQEILHDAIEKDFANVS